MFTRDDGAWITRRTIARGLVPALVVGHACAMAADPPSAGRPSGVQTLLDITGQLIAEGAECQAMRGEDGQLYTLIGDIGQWRAGSRVRVTGDRVDPSYCQQGVTIRIKTIQQAG